MAKSRWQRLNVGITHESLGELRELRFLVENALNDPAGVTKNQVIAWALHAALGLPEKQRVKLIVAGAQREADILKAGNPGNPGVNGHGSQKPVAGAGSTQRVARVKHIPRRVEASGDEATQDRQLISMTDF